MLTRLFAFIRSAFFRLVHAFTGRQDPPSPNSGGAGVTAPLLPRTPVLAGTGARSLPPDDER